MLNKNAEDTGEKSFGEIHKKMAILRSIYLKWHLLFRQVPYAAEQRAEALGSWDLKRTQKYMAGAPSSPE